MRLRLLVWLVAVAVPSLVWGLFVGAIDPADAAVLALGGGVIIGIVVTTLLIDWIKDV